MKKMRKMENHTGFLGGNLSAEAGKNGKRAAMACAVLTCGAVLLAGCGAAPVSSNVSVPSSIQVTNVENQVISVNAREEVKVVPDMAELELSVTTEEADAAACQTANSEAVDKVVAAITPKRFGQEAIHYSSYNLNPIYDWENGRTITGYSMDTSITVSDVPVDVVGEVISVSVGAGANSIQSVTYMSSKYDESYQEALAKAVESAYSKANAMAIAGGCSLGDVVKIEEHTTNSQARYTAVTNMSARDGAMAVPEAAEGAAVMPGQVSVVADILVEYAVNR